MLDKVLQYILLAICIATLLRLWRSGLHRKYPLFFLYFAIRIPYMVVPLVIDVRSRTYFNIWLWAEPLFCALYILIVVELYRLVFSKYKGLQTVGRWAMYASSVLSIAISVATLIPKIGPGRSRQMWYVLALQRGVNTSLTIFLLLMILFLSRYPIRLSRNVRVYAFIYPVYFLSGTIGTLVFSLFGVQFGEGLNLSMSILRLASTTAFLLLLTAAGEVIPGPEVAPVTSDQTQMILTKLDSLNTTLLRVSRH